MARFGCTNGSVVFILVAALVQLCGSSVVVKTKCGNVEGTSLDGAFSFRGIPYASPPVGKLRWRPPEVLSHDSGNCWNGTYKATDFGNSCFQRDPFNLTRTTGNEDCLYLNVFTPTTDPDAKKPVMVWIHGGSFQYLNGHWPNSSPSERLARDTGVVYVSFNYRLHAFGFLALRLLAEDSPTNTSGNYGVMDMIAVLGWTKANIRQFGGDPHQVTIFGHSSGGTAVFALLASPFSIGVFHRAWLASASPILNKTAINAYKDNEIFLENSGCDDIACLYSLSSTEVTSAVPWDIYPSWAMKDQNDLPTKGVFDGAIAVVDGYILPWAPLQAWKDGFALDVPLLIGSCANEIDFYPVEQTIKNWTWTDYTTVVSDKLGTFSKYIVQSALSQYPAAGISPEYQFTSLASDIRVNCPTDHLALTASKHFIHPVYRYVVTSFPSAPVHAYGIPFPAQYAFHGWDMLAFFGTVADNIPNPTYRDLLWQSNVQNEVLSFVRDGVPATATWTTYPNVTAHLSYVTQPHADFHGQQCQDWLQNGFFSYAWTN